MKKTVQEVYEEWKALQPVSERKQYLLSKRFSIDFNYNSNHIEGNTLTYGQTEILLLFGKVTGVGELRFFNEMKASAVGLQMVIEQSKDQIPMSQNFIRQLHKTLLVEDYKVYRQLPGGVQTSYTVHAGQYKTRPNSVITRTGERFEYASPEETPALMTDLVDWYNSVEGSGKYTPVELAALFHYRYIRIHPFEDGNGRIARMLVNYILARHGYPMIIVRSRNKEQYLDALDKTDKVVGDTPSLGAHAPKTQVHHFLRYMESLFTEEVQSYIDFIKETSDNVWWYDGQKITFRSENNSKILHLITEQPDITLEQLSVKVGINVSAIKKQLQSMMEAGYVERQQDKNLRIIISPSN